MMFENFRVRLAGWILPRAYTINKQDAVTRTIQVKVDALTETIRSCWEKSYEEYRASGKFRETNVPMVLSLHVDNEQG